MINEENNILFAELVLRSWGKKPRKKPMIRRQVCYDVVFSGRTRFLQGYWASSSVEFNLQAWTQHIV